MLITDVKKAKQLECYDCAILTRHHTIAGIYWTSFFIQFVLQLYLSLFFCTCL